MSGLAVARSHDQESGATTLSVDPHTRAHAQYRNTKIIEARQLGRDVYYDEFGYLDHHNTTSTSTITPER